MKLFFISLLLIVSSTHAQEKKYQVVLDTDGNPGSGCSLPVVASSSIGGQEALVEITVDQMPPVITGTSLALCSGGVWQPSGAVVDAALGLNQGDFGEDVIEIGVGISAVGINQSGTVPLSFIAQSDVASDTVIQNDNGGIIFFGFSFPVPLLGFGALLLLIIVVWVVATKQINHQKKLTVMLVLLAPAVWAMSIVIDGLITDWTGSPVATDSSGDPTTPSSLIDFTQIYIEKNDSNLFFRMDIVDLENQAPIANVVNDNVDEDNVVTLMLSASDGEGDPLTFAISQQPSNGTLSAITPINATSASVDYTPDADFFGSDSFTYVANDGQIDSAPANVNVDVDSINDAPDFVSGGNVNVVKDSGPYQAPWATGVIAGPANESGQTLTFQINSNSNAALFTSGPSIDAAGALSFEMIANASGTATIEVQLSDDGGVANGGQDTSSVVSFDITSASVNDEPSFTAGSNQSVLEDAGAQTVNGWATAISAGPADEAGQTLTFNITGNTNAALFSAGPAVDSTGNLTFTPAADANGSATITLELMDDGGTANGGDDTSPEQSFDITVTSVNDEPAFAAGANVSVIKDTGPYDQAWATAISAGPADENGQVLSFVIDSNDNAGLFSVQPALSNAGQLTFTLADDLNGTANLMVRLTDNGGTANGGIDSSPAIALVISTTAVNDEPSFTAGSNQSITEDAGAQVVNGWATAISAGPADEAGQVLTFNIIGNSNAGLFSVGPAVDSTGNLSYTPAADANGSATITLELMDNGGTANGGDDTSPAQSFDISVTAVNDEPVFTVGADQLVEENQGPQTVNGFITGVSAGPADENSQVVVFNVVGNTNPGLFSAGPSIDASGNLTFTSANSASGVATISVEAQDNGGTANGGDDTAPAQTFDINIANINDAPSFTAGANPTATDEDSGAASSAWASAISAGPANEIGQSLTFIVSQTTIDSTLTFTTAPSVDSVTGNVSYEAAANAYGSATYSVTLMDDGGTANGGVDTSPAVNLTITVNPVNDAPSVTPGAMIAVTTNTAINVPAASGLLTIAVDEATEAADPNGPSTPGTTLSVQNPTPTASTQGGSLSVNAATGAYTYNPPAGYTGADSFDATICDNGIPLPAACTPVTFNITVSGAAVWYVDNSVGSNGSGRLSDPFNSMANFIAANDGTAGNPGDNDMVFVATGSSDYDTGAGVALRAGQVMFGQATSVTPFDTYVGLTYATNSVARPVLGGTAPNLVSATGNGFTFAVVGGVSNEIRGLDIGNTPQGFALRGQVDGQLMVSEASISGTGGIFEMNGNNAGTFNGSFTELTSTQGIGTTHTLSLNGFNSTNVVTTTTTIQNPTSGAIFITNNTGQVNLGNLSNVTTTIGDAIFLQNAGTVTLGAATPSLTAVGGAALYVQNTTVNGFNFNGLSSNNGAVGVFLDNVTGNIAATSGAITNASGKAFDVNAGTGNITYGGSITNASNRAVEVTNRTTATVTLSGNVTETGLGLLFNNNAGGTITTSGTLNLNTGANQAFTATGGGTINATGTGSTITTTSGRAVEINGVNIGASNVAFQSVNKTTGTNAILLNNTGATGGFRVTGSGNVIGSGGTISGLSQEAILLTDTSNAFFNGLIVSNLGREAVLGVRVNGLTVSNGNFNNVATSGGAVTDNDVFNFDRFGSGDNGLQGTVLFQNVNVTNFNQRALDVVNEGTVSLNIDMIGFNADNNNDTVGEQAIKIESQGNNSVDVLLSNSTFNNIETNVISLFSEDGSPDIIEVTNITSTNGGGPDNAPNGGGIGVIAGNNGTVTFDINNNDLRDVFGEPIQIVGLAGQNQTAEMNGVIEDNGSNITPLVSENADGIDLDFDGSGSGGSTVSGSIVVQNNTIEFEDDAIGVDHRDASGTMNITLSNNAFVGINGDDGIANVDDGLFIFTDDDTGVPVNQINVVVSNNSLNNVIGTKNIIEIVDVRDGNKLCVDITGNSGTAGSIEFDTDAAADLRVVQSSAANVQALNNGRPVVETVAPTYNSAACF